MSTTWSIYTWTLCDGYVNCWSDGEGEPVTFETRKEAENELRNYLADVKHAVECGDLDEEYSVSDFIIAETGAYPVSKG